MALIPQHFFEHMTGRHSGMVRKAPDPESRGSGFARMRAPE